MYIHMMRTDFYKFSYFSFSKQYCCCTAVWYLNVLHVLLVGASLLLVLLPIFHSAALLSLPRRHRLLHLPLLHHRFLRYQNAILFVPKWQHIIPCDMVPRKKISGNVNEVSVVVLPCRLYVDTRAPKQRHSSSLDACIIP